MDKAKFSSPFNVKNNFERSFNASKRKIIFLASQLRTGGESKQDENEETYTYPSIMKQICIWNKGTGEWDPFFCFSGQSKFLLPRLEMTFVMLNETFNVAAGDFSESTGRFGDHTKYLRCDVYMSCLRYCYRPIQAYSAHLPFYLTLTNPPLTMYALCDCEGTACVFSAAGILFSGCTRLILYLILFLWISDFFLMCVVLLCCDKPIWFNNAFIFSISLVIKNKIYPTVYSWSQLFMTFTFW